MPRRARTEQETEAPLFEAAVDQLEFIVRRMEDDELSLEELVGEYERGITLLNFCRERLDEARGRVEAIKEKAGAAGAAGMAAGEQDTRRAAGVGGPDPVPPIFERDDNDGEDEIRLF